MHLRVTSGKSPGNWALDVRAIIETGCIIGGLLANLILLPRTLTSDSSLRFDELNQLLTTHTLSAARFSLVGPLFATPFWYLGQVSETPAWWCLRFNLVLLALGMLVFYGLLRNRATGAAASVSPLARCLPDAYPESTTILTRRFLPRSLS